MMLFTHLFPHKQCKASSRVLSLVVLWQLTSLTLMNSQGINACPSLDIRTEKQMALAQTPISRAVIMLHPYE